MAAVEQAGLVLEHHDAEAQVRTENDGSSRQAAKSKGQAAADNAAASADFALVLNSKISELESRGGTGCTSAERDSVKARRKGLRELQKFVTDKANSLEDKIAFVQAKYTLQVHAAMQLRGGGSPMQDRQMHVDDPGQPKFIRPHHRGDVVSCRSWGIPRYDIVAPWCFAQVTDFLRMEKHYFEVQKDLDLVTKERDKGETAL